jgi:CHAT domain-containing protein
MKINRISENSSHKHSKKGAFIVNVHYFFAFVRYIGIALIAVVFFAFVLIFALDRTIPSELESLDASATLKMFNELQEANRHHEAITLMEYKGNVIYDSPLEMKYKSKLADSYIHVGDYSKAEKVLLDIWNHAPKYLKDVNNPTLESMLKFGMSRQIYQFYEMMEDRANMIKYFNIYKKYYSTESLDSTMVAIYNQKTWGPSVSEISHKELVEYDSIVISHFDSHQAAICGMGKFVDKIIFSKEFGAAYKVKCLNKLIGWMLQEKQLLDTYPRIKQAVEIARSMKSVDECRVLGELSDYCYEIHDIQTSRYLYKRYEDYLSDRYSENDFEYLVNYSRKFRYYEDEKDWQTLESELVKYCMGMRQQIANNIPSMTDEQREHFVAGFDMAHNAAVEALQKHPTPKLADLCFDNISFRNGLLLRSNLAVRNSISRTGDKKVTALYDELVKCRRDLVYESVSGRIIKHTSKIEGRINELEKELALKCTDFKSAKDISDYRHDFLQKNLSSKESIVELVENNGSLFALVLNKSKGVIYVPIGNISSIQNILQKSIDEIYHDERLADFIWGNINKVIPNVTDIYYLPVGKFNQIALGSLYLGKNQYLCDVVNLRLLQDPTTLNNKKQLIADSQLFGVSNNVGMVSLWGGIDYGQTTKSAIGNNRRSAIKRGENLVQLTFTKFEVQTISSMLKNKSIPNHVYENVMATESSFKKRSGKGDYILHISTHGFFNDSTNLSNSMLSSGLFFAGANDYWCNDSLLIEKGKDDGILRAAEIANVDLSGCSLVVLSACETGLGFSDSSEGVYGLQRAFKLAGAKKVLMSLWEVDDRATTILMTNFYRNLLEGKDANAALEISKQVVREQYPSPRDWGAFVLLN